MAYTGTYFESDEFQRLLGGDVNNKGVANSTLAKSFGRNDVLPNFTAERKGVYAQYPASTPKYTATNDDRSLKTQARLLIAMPSDKEFNTFMASYNGYSDDVRQMARLLVAVPAKYQNLSNKVGYLDFLLTSAQETFEEKVQLDDVVGDNFVAYFFGQRPPIFSYQGVLMNTKQDDWRAAMTMIYLNILRGTQLARRGKMVTLAYDKYAITGAFLNMTQVLTAEMQMASTFSFQMLVKRIDIERTQNSIPTYIAGLPYAVDPDSFSTQTFAPPKITMRTTNTPAAATTARAKADPPATQEPEPTSTASDVRGALAPVRQAHAAVFLKTQANTNLGM